MTDNPYENYLLNIQADKKQNEKDFQKAWEEHDVDKMWWCIYITCLNIAKSIYKSRGVTVPDEVLLERAVDGAGYCMKFILGKNVRPERLSSYCYLRVRRFIDEPKTVWYDMNVVQFPEDKYKEGKDMEMSNNNIYEERYE